MCIYLIALVILYLEHHGITALSPACCVDWHIDLFGWNFICRSDSCHLRLVAVCAHLHTFLHHLINTDIGDIMRNCPAEFITWCHYRKIQEAGCWKFIFPKGIYPCNKRRHMRICISYFDWWAVICFEHEFIIPAFRKTGIFVIKCSIECSNSDFGIIIYGWRGHHFPVPKWDYPGQFHRCTFILEIAVTSVQTECDGLIYSRIPWCWICKEDKISYFEPAISVIGHTFLCGHFDPDIVKAGFQCACGIEGNCNLAIAIRCKWTYRINIKRHIFSCHPIFYGLDFNSRTCYIISAHVNHWYWKVDAVIAAECFEHPGSGIIYGPGLNFIWFFIEPAVPDHHFWHAIDGRIYPEFHKMEA